MADQHTSPTIAGQHLAGSHDKAPAADAGRYIVGDWSHIFADDGPSTDVRIVFDTGATSTPAARSWRTCRIAS
jgi:hypothetical protein